MIIAPATESGTSSFAIGVHRNMRRNETPAFIESERLGQTPKNGILIPFGTGITPVDVRANNSPNERTVRSHP